MLEKFNMLSANQLNTSVKLLEVWKALKLDKYPLEIKRQENNEGGVNTRADLAGRPIEMGKSVLSQKTCLSDAIHLWNRSPSKVTESMSLYQAKKEIRDFVKLLPV